MTEHFGVPRGEQVSMQKLKKSFIHWEVSTNLAEDFIGHWRCLPLMGPLPICYVGHCGGILCVMEGS